MIAFPGCFCQKSLCDQNRRMLKLLEGKNVKIDNVKLFDQFTHCNFVDDPNFETMLMRSGLVILNLVLVECVFGASEDIAVFLLYNGP